MKLTLITCSDNRMDISDTNMLLDTPVNTYSINCEECKFPNVDKTPNPYYLLKNKIYSGIEISIADLGNLLVSTRLKEIITYLFPNSCYFQKTYVDHEDIPTKWWLAIINNKVITGEVKENIPRCGTCNEPLHAHPGSQYKYWNKDIEDSYDIMKSENWMCVSESDWKQSWISRDVYLSIRFIGLLKKLQIKGVNQYAFSKFKTLSSEEKEWIKKTIECLPEYLKRTRNIIDIDEINWLNIFLEKKVNYNKKNELIYESKFKLKSDEVIKILCNINETISLDKNRINLMKFEDWILNYGYEKSKRKLIAFCSDKYGNYWSFDSKDKNHPVYFYNHELMDYELLFENVVEFIKSTV